MLHLLSVDSIAADQMNIAKLVTTSQKFVCHQQLLVLKSYTAEPSTDLDKSKVWLSQAILYQTGCTLERIKDIG